MWKKNWERRIWLFDTLIWTVMGYRTEVWRERKEIERVHERYLKWTFGLNWRTPGYMVKNEVEREKMRGRARKRA